MPSKNGNGHGPNIVSEPTDQGIQNMHDMLNEWLHDERLEEVLHEDDIVAMKLYRDAMCWALGHENTAMSDNVGIVMGLLADAGFFVGH